MMRTRPVAPAYINLSAKCRLQGKSSWRTHARKAFCVYIAILVDTTVHLQDSARHIYVEVVLHGKTEGKFLEDTIGHEETLGQVSKLGGFWRLATE